MNTIILDSIEDAQKELANRKKYSPNLIHRIENINDSLIIETLSTAEYLDKIYLKQTGKQRTGINKSIMQLVKTFSGYLNERLRK